MLRQCAELYRELIKIEIPPPIADLMELWQIAALMQPSARDVANDPAEMNRRIAQMRVQAAREGRELDPDEVFNGMSESQIQAMAAAPVGSSV